MAKKNKLWFSGEDAQLAARFTKFMTKVLYARRASYIRALMVKAKREVSIIIKFVRSIPYLRRAETQNCHSSAIKQKQSVTFLGNGINPPKNVALLFC